MNKTSKKKKNKKTGKAKKVKRGKKTKGGANKMQLKREKRVYKGKKTIKTTSRKPLDGQGNVIQSAPRDGPRMEIRFRTGILRERVVGQAKKAGLTLNTFLNELIDRALAAA